MHGKTLTVLIGGERVSYNAMQRNVECRAFVVYSAVIRPWPTFATHTRPRWLRDHPYITYAHFFRLFTTPPPFYVILEMKMSKKSYFLTLWPLPYNWVSNIWMVPKRGIASVCVGCGGGCAAGGGGAALVVVARGIILEAFLFLPFFHATGSCRVALLMYPTLAQNTT